MDTLLDNIKASIFSGKENLIKDLDKSNAENVRLIVDKDFATLKPHMQGFMIQRGSSTQLSHAQKWLSTPLGKKIAESKLIPLILFTDPESPIPVKDPNLSREREQLEKIRTPAVHTDGQHH